jgi:hypothetical protein
MTKLRKVNGGEAGVKPRGADGILDMGIARIAMIAKD